MPKMTCLDDVFESLTKEKPKQPSAFLIALGTDTQFTEKPVVVQKPANSPYELGEFYSFLMQYITHLLGEKGEKHKGAISYVSESVTVIDGPDTAGTLVGDRISKLVLQTLGFAASGKETLILGAHSRGAVETMLALHEIHRIKEELASEDTPKSLHEILCNSTCPYTKAAMQKLSKSVQDKPQNRKLLLERLNKLNLNAFLLDPVPGGRLYGLPYTRWDDPRFYDSLSEKCNSLELYLCRDERSGCFRPIVAKDMQPIVIPGHHGTTSGNLYTQKLNRAPVNGDTSTIMKLMICKFLHFSHTVTANAGQTLFTSLNEDIDCAHPDLQQIANEFMKRDQKARYNLLLNHYLSVKQNDQAFLSLAQDGYIVVGIEDIKGQRYVHYRAHNDFSMGDIAPSLQGEFVNTEHALLYLRQYIQFDEIISAKPVEQLQHITTALADVLKILLSLPAENEDEKTQRLRKLFENEQGRKVFFSGFSMLIDAVSQTYLRNNLSSQEKQQLMQAIKEPFNVLSLARRRLETFAESGTISINTYINILDGFEKILQSGLKKTVEEHASLITQRAKSMQKQLHLFLAPEQDFQQTLTCFKSGLNKLGESEALTSIRKCMEELDPVNVTTVKEALKKELEAINNSEFQDREKVFKQIVELATATNLNAHIEAQQRTYEQYLQELEQINEAAQVLDGGYDTLSGLVSKGGEQTIEINRDELCQHSDTLVKASARLLLEKQHDLQLQPELISHAFFETVKKRAISLGAIDPEKRSLQENLVQKEQALQKMVEEAKQQEEKLTAKTEEIEKQQQTLNEKDKTISQHETSIKKHQEEFKIKQEFIETLASKKEVECAHIIQTKLLVYTEQHLQHLFQEAQKYKDIQGSHLDSLNGFLDMGNPKSTANYKQIQDTHQGVRQLYEELSNPNVLPSEKIKAFHASLMEMEKNLNLTDNVDWSRFRNRCLLAIAIIFTGIIPGLIVMGIYAAATSHSMSFFAKGTGGRYQENCELSAQQIPAA